MTSASGIENLKAETLEALEIFCQVQEKHRCGFEKGPIKGLSAWQDERRQAFTRLQRCLERLAVEPAAVETDAAFGGRLKALLARAMAGESLLGEVAGRRRDEVQARLAGLRKGRRSVRGYSLHQGKGAGPRFLSNRT